MDKSPPPGGGTSAHPEPTSGRRRGRPRDPGTDARITTAAAELLLLHGFDRTTVDDVASRAGVGKATVYRRWPSKEDLAVAAMETLYDAEMPEPDTGSIRSDLVASYHSVLTFVNSPEGAAFMRTVIAESVRDDRIAEMHRASSEKREGYHRETIERGIARGEVRADIDIDIAVQWLGGLLASRAVTRRPMPSIEDVEGLLDLTLRGIGVGQS